MGISAIGTRKNVSVIDTTEYEGMKVEVLEYNKLQGSTDTSAAMDMYFMEQQNIKARQVAIYLNNDKVKVEPGAMSYFKGNLEMVSGVTPGKLIGKMFSAAVTGESVAQPEYKGTGMVVLEPSFNHFLKVDVNFAILRSGNINFTVERSAKTLIGSAVSGEGLVNVYRGIGTVWLAPTIKVYDAINKSRALGINNTTNMNMNTSNSK